MLLQSDCNNAMPTTALPSPASPSCPASPEETRLCPTCLQPWPLTEFRLRRKGSDVRHSQCRGCRNRTDRKRTARERATALRQFIAQVNAVESENEAGSFATLTAAVVQRLGGPAAFVQAWSEHLEAAMARKPGNRYVLASFRAISRMILAAQHKAAGMAGEGEEGDVLDVGERW